MVITLGHYQGIVEYSCQLVVAIPEFRKFCVNFVNLPLESWHKHFAAMQAVDQAVRLFLGFWGRGIQWCQLQV